MTLRQFGHVVELRTKTISVSSFLIGTLYAVLVTGHFSLIRFLLMAVAVLAVDMGTTAFNTYFDFVRGVDDRRFVREADKVLVHQGLAPHAALLVSVGLYGVALCYGLALTQLAGWPVAVVGAAGLLVGFLYNGGPLPISRTPCGEIFAGGFLGTALILLSFHVQAGPVAAQSWGRAFAVSLPSFLLIGSILTVNNTCDIQGDRAAGRRTLSILIGRRAGEILVYGLGTAAFALLMILAATGILPPTVWAVVPLAGLPAVQTWRRMRRRGFSHATKRPSMGGILRVFNLYSLLLILSLLVALLLR